MGLHVIENPRGRYRDRDTSQRFDVLHCRHSDKVETRRILDRVINASEIVSRKELIASAMTICGDPPARIENRVCTLLMLYEEESA